MRKSSFFALAALSLFAFFALACSRDPAERSTALGPSSSSSARDAQANDAGPIRIEPLGADENPPIFVLRGGARGSEKLVFLHGMCGHGLGYAEAIQNSAARRGTLLAPQGDVPCGSGPEARWSKDIDALDARIVRAFRAVGVAEPIDDIVVIGYSQGATRAEWLVRKFPERYTRLVLIGGPYAAKAEGLEKLRAAVAMAGDRDRLDLMQASARVLKAASIPATFMLIPEAAHGSMGAHPDLTMDQVFTWLAENQRAKRP